MKNLRKKIINNREYYYLETALKTKTKGRKITVSTFLGPVLPAEDVLKTKIKKHFNEVYKITSSVPDQKHKKYFPDTGLETIEKSRTDYTVLSLFDPFRIEFEQFRVFFYVLFVLNSHRAEGSKVTEGEIERSLNKRHRGRTRAIDIEIQNAIGAMNFAFSNEMKWNTLAIKKIHRLLFKDLHPEAGEFRIEGVQAPASQKGGQSDTTPPEKIRSELKKLLEDTRKKIGREYPPITALEFHWRFERIHPFRDGNGRVGRIILNAMLLKYGFSPVIFFESGHKNYCTSIAKARNGHSFPLATYFVKQLKRTHEKFSELVKGGKLSGRSNCIDKWEIQLKRSPRTYGR